MSLSPLLRRAASPATAALMLAAGTALAHTGHDDVHADAGAALFAGLSHPVGGADHLLAMVAVGLWAAAALPAGRRWQAPAVFVGTMVAAALAAQAGVGLPAGGLLEVLIAASVVLLGAMLVAGHRLAPAAGLGLTALAALLHGSAHGLEFAGAAPAAFAAYAGGFALATALLHGLGLAAGSALQSLRGAALRVAGVGVGSAGLVLLATRL
jgi:urease accessory protein